MADSTQESLLRPEHEEQRTGGGPTQAYSCVHCRQWTRVCSRRLCQRDVETRPALGQMLMWRRLLSRKAAITPGMLRPSAWL